MLTRKSTDYETYREPWVGVTRQLDFRENPLWTVWLKKYGFCVGQNGRQPLSCPSFTNGRPANEIERLFYNSKKSGTAEAYGFCLFGDKSFFYAREYIEDIDTARIIP